VVTDSLDRELAAAAQALREFEAARRRRWALEDPIKRRRAEWEQLRSRLAVEEQDVARLETLSLTSVLAQVTGRRGDGLARERAEVEALQYRVAEAQSRLDAVIAEHAAARGKERMLAAAVRTFDAALVHKEQQLTGSADPRGRRLLNLAEEDGRIRADLVETDEALSAATEALAALADAQELLGSAAKWSRYDVATGGDIISGAIKHSRLDRAALAADRADRCLAGLRRELADVGGAVSSARLPEVDGLTRFADIWLDNIFSDFSVHNRIGMSQQEVSRVRLQVAGLRTALTERQRRLRKRSAAIAGQRQDLLTDL
jgi:hypothetical protein